MYRERAMKLNIVPLACILLTLSSGCCCVSVCSPPVRCCAPQCPPGTIAQPQVITEFHRDQFGREYTVRKLSVRCFSQPCCPNAYGHSALAQRFSDRAEGYLATKGAVLSLAARDALQRLIMNGAAVLERDGKNTPPNITEAEARLLVIVENLVALDRQSVTGAGFWDFLKRFCPIYPFC